jgi:BlaI family transcriptional regulator, penicillinase repressor
MKPKQKSLTDVQTEIMAAVWAKGEATVSDVLDALPKTRRLARTTVQTLLGRLEAKGWLTHREEGNSFVYRATASHRQSKRGIIARVLDTVFNGSVEGLMMALLEQRGVSIEEAERIKAMITQTSERNPSKKQKP